MIALPPATNGYSADDQNSMRRTLTTVVKKLDAADIQAANAAKQAIANAAIAAQNAADAAAQAASASSDAADAQTIANDVKVITDLGFDAAGMLKSGVLGSATIGEVYAGYVGKAQHGIFYETFEAVPSDWNVRTAAVHWASVADGQAGGHSLQLEGQGWYAFPYNIAFDPSKLYRIRTRVKHITGGTRDMYCGVEGVGADGVTYVDPSGANSTTGFHYVCSPSTLIPADGQWHEYTGWFKGWGAVAPSADPLHPSPLHPLVRYFRPAFILNFGASDGVSEIDYIAIDVLDEDSVNRAYTAITEIGDLSRGAANGSISADVLAASLNSAGANVIVNGGGQAGQLGVQADGWVFSSGNPLTASDSASWTGDRSLQFVTPALSNNNSFQEFVTKAGDVWEISARIKRNSASAASVFYAGAWIEVAQPANTIVVIDHTGDLATFDATDSMVGVKADGAVRGWEVVRMKFQTPTAGTIRVYASAYQLIGTVNFDDVVLQRLTPGNEIGAYRASNALDSNARLVDQTHIPAIGTAGIRAQAFLRGTGTPLDGNLTSSGSAITIPPFDLYIGLAAPIQYAGGSCTGTTGQKNYVFAVDANYAGQSTFAATTDIRALANDPSRIYLGFLTPQTSGAGLGSGCPSPDTPILLATGETVFAGDLEPGTLVATKDENWLEWTIQPITHVSHEINERWELALVDGRRIVASKNHRIRTVYHGWKELHTLQAGDMLVGSPPGEVASVRNLGQGPVVRITVANAHTYMTRGILSHNTKVV